jgi:hypothetical protein
VNDKRLELLSQWAYSIVAAARAGALTGDPTKPIAILGVETIRGPRAGALEIKAGLDAGKLLRVLAADDYALHRQFIPWEFIGEPAVYMAGRFVRLEAGWPSALAEKNIKLSDLVQRPKNGGRWIAGKNEVGATITLGLSDTIPHFLFGGWTGSGKTWAMRSAVAQLARDPDNRLVLIDCKYGDGLGILAHLPHLVGPVAMDAGSAKAALSWAVAELRRRYQTGDKEQRIIVAIDEMQELCGRSGDPAIVEMVRRLIAQGRGARVHVLVGTQHPTLDTFSDPTVRRNLVGRVALRTEDYKASEVVVGGPTPRADRLLGAGDSYAIVPGAVHRAQLAYIPPAELERMNMAESEMATWPEYDPEAAGTLPPASESAGWSYTGAELAVAILTAWYGKGRPTLLLGLEAAGLRKPGAEKAIRLLSLGRETVTWLGDQGWQICRPD